LNEKFNDIHPRSQNKHDKIQISFLIFTALCYLLHTIRAYIPENMQTSYRNKTFSEKKFSKILLFFLLKIFGLVLNRYQLHEIIHQIYDQIY